MHPSSVLKIARKGVVIDSIALHDVHEAIASGRLLASDHYLDPDSNTWKVVSEIETSRGKVSEAVETAASNSPPLVISVIVGVVASSVIFMILYSTSLSRPRPESAAPVVNQESPAKRLQKAEIKVQALMPRFKAISDKFEKTTWYQHVEHGSLYQQLLNSGQGGLLLVNVNSYGGRYLTSYYLGSRPINYQFVQFLIDGEKYGTLGPSNYDKSLDVVDQGTLEHCNHVWDEDRALLGLLAASVRAGKKISCRLSNVLTNTVYDREPGLDELRVLAETLEFADALRERKEAAVAAGSER